MSMCDTQQAGSSIFTVRNVAPLERAGCVKRLSAAGTAPNTRGTLPCLAIERPLGVGVGAGSLGWHPVCDLRHVYEHISAEDIYEIQSSKCGRPGEKDISDVEALWVVRAGALAGTFATALPLNPALSLQRNQFYGLE